MVRINVGRLALMPGATLDDALSFADELADLCEHAGLEIDVSVGRNGQRHEVAGGTDSEHGQVASLIDRLSEAWKLATDRPTIKCPVAAEVAA